MERNKRKVSQPQNRAEDSVIDLTADSGGDESGIFLARFLYFRGKTSINKLRLFFLILLLVVFSDSKEPGKHYPLFAKKKKLGSKIRRTPETTERLLSDVVNMGFD